MPPIMLSKLVVVVVAAGEEGRAIARWLCAVCAEGAEALGGQGGRHKGGTRGVQQVQEGRGISPWSWNLVVVVAGRHACGCVPSPSLANTLSTPNHHTIDLIDLAEAGG